MDFKAMGFLWQGEISCIYEGSFQNDEILIQINPAQVIISLIYHNFKKRKQAVTANPKNRFLIQQKELSIFLNSKYER